MRIDDKTLVANALHIWTTSCHTDDMTNPKYYNNDQPSRLLESLGLALPVSIAIWIAIIAILW
jgi:hypothetical protein